MSDVRRSPETTLTAERPQEQGDFIWYELMTPDPAGAKAFYDAVVGWKSKPSRTSRTATG